MTQNINYPHNQELTSISRVEQSVSPIFSDLSTADLFDTCDLIQPYPSEKKPILLSTKPSASPIASHSSPMNSSIDLHLLQNNDNEKEFISSPHIEPSVSSVHSNPSPMSPPVSLNALPQYQGLKEIEDPKQSMIQEKKVRTYADSSHIPYFLHRQGFPNFSARNCDYNSLAVLYAHTNCSIPFIHPDNEKLYQKLNQPDNFQETLCQNIENLKQQHQNILLEINKIQDEQQVIQNNEIHLKNELQLVKSDLKSLENEHLLLTEEISSIESKINLSLDHIHLLKDKRKELYKSKEYLQSAKLDEVTEQEARKEIYKKEIEINDIEIQFVRFNFIESAPKKPIKEQLDNQLFFKNQQIKIKKEELNKKEKELKEIQNKNKDILSIHFPLKQSEQKLKMKIQQMKCALENQAQLPRAHEVLAILRGEIQGDLSMEDAQLICETIKTANSREIYKGSKDVSEDYECAKLKEAFYHSNWRGLRVGGHGHWWVYIRNPDGKTVDEINDIHVYPKRMTIDQIFRKYSNPKEWIQSQITFFDGVIS